MLRLSGAAICAAVMALLLRRLRPEMGIAVSMGAGILLALLTLPLLSQVVSGLNGIAQAGGLTENYMTSLLKVCGVSLLMDFASQTCRDAGEDGLALKVDLAGRITLISLSLPFMQALLTQIISLSP